jgi:endonuclease YncB( thermonuclease family)
VARRALPFALTAVLACGANPRGEGDGSPRQTSTNAAAASVSPTARPVAAASASEPAREPCVIASVTDGDSLRCTDQRRVRLLLLDAPEMDQAPFGQRARDALRQRLRRGDTAWLEFDVQRLDRYERTLAYVWTAPRGGTHVNLEHARDGWAVAVVFPPNVRHIDAVRAAVADACAGRRGLWADGAFRCEPIAHERGDC